jgi:hypothetical protein
MIPTSMGMIKSRLQTNSIEFLNSLIDIKSQFQLKYTYGKQNISELSRRKEVETYKRTHRRTQRSFFVS